MYIEVWDWDDDNLGELVRHDLTARIVEQVAQGPRKFRRNKKHHSATYQMVGPDFGGQIWVICIVQSLDAPGCWRAITGWRADQAEKEWYRR